MNDDKKLDMVAKVSEISAMVVIFAVTVLILLGVYAVADAIL